MQQDFWLERWARNEIGFHLPDVNPRLPRFWPELQVPAGATVFVPLCGKSLDLHWLAAHGHHVIGVELAEAAVQAFFAEAGLTSRIDESGALPRHSADGIDIYCGDIFELCRRLAERGALLLAASDKPAESAIPSPEQLAAGMRPLHRTPARVE